MTMRRWGLLAVLCLLACGGCSQRAYYEIHGRDLISTTAPATQAAKAVNETASALAESVERADGRTHKPSLMQSSRRWSKGKTGQKDVRVVRSVTKFTDTSGRQVTIESLRHDEYPILLFIKEEPVDESMTVVNEIVRRLEQWGVRHKP
jgi:hypothetical protein